MLPVQSFPPFHAGASGSPFSRPMRVVNVGHWPQGFLVPRGAWIIRTGANVVEMAVAPTRRGKPRPQFLHEWDRPWPRPPVGPGPPAPPPRGGKTINVNLTTDIDVASWLPFPAPSWPQPPCSRPPPCPRWPPRLRPFYAYTDVPAYTNDDWMRGRPFMRRDVWPPHGHWTMITLAQPFSVAPVILSDGWNVRIRGAGDALMMQAYSV